LRSTRREFMRTVGVMLVSLLAARCGRTTCYTPSIPTSTLVPAEDGWERLYASWDGLDLLAVEAQDLERGEQTRDRLITEHRAALDDLVAADELDAAVAGDMQLAFEGAATHVWRANAPITCYIPAPYPEYGVQSSSDLARQADLLAEMAAQSDIDPAVVEEARTAIERDVAFLSMSADEQEALVQAIVDAAGEDGPFPALSELTFDIPPEPVAAAQTLVELLLSQR